MLQCKKCSCCCKVTGHEGAGGVGRCGWSGVAKVSCILCHRGVQLILAYWVRLAILVTGKVEGNDSLFLLFLFSLSLETTQNDTQGLTCR